MQVVCRGSIFFNEYSIFLLANSWNLVILLLCETCLLRNSGQRDPQSTSGIPHNIQHPKAENIDSLFCYNCIIDKSSVFTTSQEDEVK